MWQDSGEDLVILQVTSEKDLLALEEHARFLSLPCCLVRDAGRTQVASGTITALGLGPGSWHRLNKVIGEVKAL